MNAVVPPLGMHFKFFRDFFLAVSGADDDAVFLKTLLIVCEAADWNGGRSEKTVAARSATRSHAGDEELQRFAIEHRHHPPNGANEPCTLETSPGHGAWPGQVVHRARQDRRQNLFGGSAELGLLGGKVLSL